MHCALKKKKKAKSRVIELSERLWRLWSVTWRGKDKAIRIALSYLLKIISVLIAAEKANVKE